MNELRTINISDKNKGWHTAFYYFAEHLRLFSKGSVNHKRVFSLVGENGRYINNDNPLIRKSAAAALSRTIHSSRYAREMQTRQHRDVTTFQSAAKKLSADLLDYCNNDSSVLFMYLHDSTWPDIRKGLANERTEGRFDIDLLRADAEMRMFSDKLFCSKLDDKEKVELLVEAFLQMLAYGHLDECQMRRICDENPTIDLHPIEHEDAESSEACLVCFAGTDNRKIKGAWRLDSNKPFVIGRYTDCDAIVTDANISREHCRITYKSGNWFIQDSGSLNGCKVIRADSVIFDSLIQQQEACQIQYGDHIVLADVVDFWFGSVDGEWNGDIPWNL